jgi:hypothetical protein
MATGGSGKRRFGGRWVQEGDQYRDRYRVLRAILTRFWYLLVPFIGVMWAHSSYVRPTTEDIKSTKNHLRKELLDAQDDVRHDVSALQTEIQTVSAEIDTLYMPQVRFYRAQNDSLVRIRSIYDQTLPQTQARVDSLRLVRDSIATEVTDLERMFAERSQVMEGLVSWQETLVDSIEGLDSQIALRTDELYRARNPEEYRRREALFTGEGRYPRRDENPQREGGR